MVSCDILLKIIRSGVNLKLSFLVVILLIGLDNGNAIFRTSADVFFTAILFDNNHMAHSNALRQILPIPSSNDGYEYLSCGDDGRVLHINSSLFN